MTPIDQYLDPTKIIIGRDKIVQTNHLHPRVSRPDLTANAVSGVPTASRPHRTNFNRLLVDGTVLGIRPGALNRTVKP
jgi:hypothetical protein